MIKVSQIRHINKQYLTFSAISVTINDIVKLFPQIVAKSGSKPAAYKVLGISATHYKRILKDPVKYKGALEVSYFKGLEYLEADKLKGNIQSTPAGYEKNNENEHINDGNKMIEKLDHFEFIIKDLVNKINKQLEENKRDKTIMTRLEEQNKAYEDYFRSNRTKEDEKIMHARIKEIERIYKAAKPIQEYPTWPDEPA